MRNKKTLLKITLTAVFTTLVILATQLKISTGMGEGYIHVGDSIIYLSACVLPFPYCLIASSLGGALADVLAGYAVWAIPTAIIKTLITLPFAIANKNNDKILNNKTAVMPFASGIISIFGYFVAECILYSTASATLSIIGNIIQATASGILFCVIAKALDKMNFKRRIYNG